MLEMDRVKKCTAKKRTVKKRGRTLSGGTTRNKRDLLNYLVHVIPNVPVV